jgi:hypothetical protein
VKPCDVPMTPSATELRPLRRLVGHLAPLLLVAGAAAGGAALGSALPWPHYAEGAVGINARGGRWNASADGELASYVEGERQLIRSRSVAKAAAGDPAWAAAGLPSPGPDRLSAGLDVGPLRDGQISVGFRAGDGRVAVVAVDAVLKAYRVAQAARDALAERRLVERLEERASRLRLRIERCRVERESAAAERGSTADLVRRRDAAARRYDHLRAGLATRPEATTPGTRPATAGPAVGPTPEATAGEAEREWLTLGSAAQAAEANDSAEAATAGALAAVLSLIAERATWEPIARARVASGGRPAADPDPARAAVVGRGPVVAGAGMLGGAAAAATLVLVRRRRHVK